MKTIFLDKEIERLNILERTGDLSEYGELALLEYKEIKKQLRLHVVVVPKYEGTWVDENRNKLGMCNCCGDNNCHDAFCKG